MEIARQMSGLPSKGVMRRAAVDLDGLPVHAELSIDHKRHPEEVQLSINVELSKDFERDTIVRQKALFAFICHFLLSWQLMLK